MRPRTMPSLDYVHVDVFSRAPYGGNSLAVFPDARGLTAAQMLRITRELRHFETIFLEPAEAPDRVRARVFDLFEELPFAGHPIIGAAAVLHARAAGAEHRNWQIALPDRVATIATARTAHGYCGLLDQGPPAFLGIVEARAEVAAAFALVEADLRDGLPLEIVSTGLRYLIVPVRAGALAKAKILRDVGALLAGHGAQFAVLFDEEAREIRHWNNDGILEDVAT